MNALCITLVLTSSMAGSDPKICINIITLTGVFFNLSKLEILTQRMILSHVFMNVGKLVNPLLVNVIQLKHC